MMKKFASDAITDITSAINEARTIVTQATESEVPSDADIQIRVSNGFITIQKSGRIIFDPSALLLQDSVQRAEFQKSYRTAMTAPYGKACSCCNGSGRE